MAIFSHDPCHDSENRYNLTGERQKGHVYYRCHTRTCAKISLKEELIDVRFSAALASVTLPPNALPILQQEFAALMKERFGSREAVRQARTLQLSQIDERLSRLTDRYLDGDIERGWYITKKTALITERTLLSEQMAQLDDIGKPAGTKFEQYFERQKDLQKGIGSFLRSEIACFMNLATSNLSVRGRSLLIDWKNEFREIQKLKAVTNSWGGGIRTPAS